MFGQVPDLLVSHPNLCGAWNTSTLVPVVLPLYKLPYKRNPGSYVIRHDIWGVTENKSPQST